MQKNTLAPTPPIADLKRRSGRSSVFKAIKKSFSFIILSSVFREPSHVTTSNIYGDAYSLDVAPSDIFERMLRDDLKTTGPSDRTPYNNGAIHDLRSGRSAFHLSSNYKLNASTIPTLFVATDPKVTPQSLLSCGSSPPRLEVPIPNQSLQMPEVVALRPVSLAQSSRVASPSSTLPPGLPQLRTARSLRLPNAVKDLSEQPLAASPIQ